MTPNTLVENNLEKKSEKNHMLEGSVIRSIIKIAVPVMTANLLQTLYQLVDTFWVGRLGEAAVAAVSLSFPILFFLLSIAIGIATAGSILVAQYNGRKRPRRVSFTVAQTLTLTVLAAIALSIIGYVLTEPILAMMTKDPLVLNPAILYMKISVVAMTGLFVFNIFQSAMNGVGNVKLPTIIILITVILNFFLDPILMFGWRFIPAMGVSGVAMATLITQYTSSLIGILLLIKGTHGVRLFISDFKPRITAIKKLVKLGFPSAIEMSARSFSMVLMTFLVASFGTTIVASFGIGGRMLSFVIIPGVGFAIATSILIGNNLGARKKQRAQLIAKTAMNISFFTLATLGVLMFLFAPQIAAFFVPDEIEVIRISSTFIRIMALSFGLIGIMMVIIGTLRAAGKTTNAMLIAIFHAGSMFIIGYILSKYVVMSEFGIWLAYPIANILAVLLAFYVYEKKDWLKKEIV